MKHISDYLTREEIAHFTRASNWAGGAAVATSWAGIGLAFSLVAWRPSVLTVLLALIILGGRQLALAILMHEAAHRSLFRTRALNDFIGKWLCAAPVWGDVVRYRLHHLTHHSQTGTEQDPDLSLVTPFPVDRASLARKLLRDVSGVSGVRRVVGLLAIDFGFIGYTVSNEFESIPKAERPPLIATGLRNMAPFILTNLALGGALVIVGHGYLYLLWLASYLTTYGLFLRIRSMAEHACTERSEDVFANTRTTRANVLARLTVAPHRVNFHIEHHLLMTVPYFRLPALHRTLRERGALEDAHVSAGYGDVLRLMSQRPATTP